MICRPWSAFSAAVLVLALGGQGPALAQRSAAQPAEKELVAVLEFDASGVSRQQSVAITDRMRQRLLESGRFRLVEREMMDKILAEQAFQQTGCTSQECAVQVGKVLGVRKMINGRVSKVGDTAWVLAGTMTDVETAETLRAASVDVRGDFLAALGEGTANLTLQLIGQTSEGLSDILKAAGIGPQGGKPPKTTHSGFGMALTYGQLGGTLGLTNGGEAKLDAQVMGGTLSYLWELKGPWGVAAFFRTMGAWGDPKDMVKDLPSNVEGADGITFNVLGVEARYWISEALHAGLLTGYAQDIIHYKQTGGGQTDDRSKAGSGGPTWGGSMYGLSLGWQGAGGWMADAEYLMMEIEGQAKDSISGLALSFGYRF